MTHTKSRLLLDFSRGAQRVSPVCCGLLLWFRWEWREKVYQSPHGRDGQPPSFPLQSLISKGQWYQWLFHAYSLVKKTIAEDGSFHRDPIYSHPCQCIDGPD